MEKLIAIYGRVAEVLPRFDKLSVSFQIDPAFHQVLALIYVDIVDLHLQVYCFFHEKSRFLLHFCALISISNSPDPKTALLSLINRWNSSH
jgi:hypothetical protein